MILVASPTAVAVVTAAAAAAKYHGGSLLTYLDHLRNQGKLGNKHSLLSFKKIIFGPKIPTFQYFLVQKHVPIFQYFWSKTVHRYISVPVR
jgi:hypothetical protein